MRTVNAESCETYERHETADVEDGAKIGEGTRIWHYAHVRKGAIIGRHCNIGRGVYIDTGVIIGDNVKIQNYCSIYNGVRIDNDVFIGPHVTTTNDLHPRAIGTWNLTATYFEQGCSIGAGSVIVCGVVIGAHSMVAAGSVVTRNVLPYMLVRGNPARFTDFVCECGRKLRKTGQRHVYQCGACLSLVNLRGIVEARANEEPTSVAELG